MEPDAGPDGRQERDWPARLEDRIAAWQVVVERVAHTETSVLAFGHRDAQPVVLKVVKRRGEEWRSGAILDAFGGRGVVRVYEHVGGAVLLERLRPGEALAARTLAGDDDEATRALAETMRTMAPGEPGIPVPAVEEWGRSLDRYAAGGDTQVPAPLVAAARERYGALCCSQTRIRLLHGDLHHYNVLRDTDRGWVAIDPKGVLGEPEYEAGAALRNPYTRPDIFADPAVIRRRAGSLAGALDLDETRVLSWAFAQAVLAAVWQVEDGIAIEAGNGCIALARALQPMLPGGASG